MRFVTSAAAVIALAAASTSVIAATARLDDVQYVAANRCLGLMSSKALASPEADALRKFLKSQQGGRDPYISDTADQARDNAQSAAGRAGGEMRARLVAERDGVCQTYLPPADSMASHGGPGAGSSSIHAASPGL